MPEMTRICSRDDVLRVWVMPDNEWRMLFTTYNRMLSYATGLKADKILI